MLCTDYAYVLSQSIRAKDTERGFIYPIDKSLLCKSGVALYVVQS